MAYDLVIVESPGKVKKISSYLGANFRVMASFGHFRDLPEEGGLGVSFNGEAVDPHYEVTSKGKKAVAEMKRMAKEAQTIYLASDFDREGEAIAWHCTQVLGKKHTFKRAVFTEITKTAIVNAISQARAIDQHLVNAQQARRILDRVVGWTVSPTLMQGTNNREAKSAGRVQSPAVLLVVTREREIQAFKPLSYWTIDAGLTAPGREPKFRARLVKWNGKGVDKTIPNKVGAEAIVADLKRLPMWWVMAVDRKPLEKKAPAPFVTSTLQQAASVAFKWKPKYTMELAQKLYESSAITYMRTDSVNLSADAVQAIRRWITERLGAEYLPPVPNIYSSASGAQEAHEAVRAVNLELDASTIADEDQRKLYAMIFQRTIACQCVPGRDQVTAVTIGAAGAERPEHPPGVFVVKGTTVEFDGWRKALAALAEDEVDQEREIGDPTNSNTIQLPPLAAGDELKLGILMPAERTTKPPPRYSEASLIKALEKLGIGRPSTYASILSTIQERNFVGSKADKLFATDLGCLVVDYLVKTFSGHMIDVRFTSEIEKQLDEIASGKLDWQKAVAKFSYDLRDRARAAGLDRDPLAEGPPPAAAKKPKPTTEPGVVCPKCGGGMVRRSGQYGEYLTCLKYSKCSGKRSLASSEQLSPAPASPSKVPPATSDALSGTPPCPICGGAMNEKKGPIVDGRPKYHFYGCCTYPACRGTRPIS